MRVHSAHPHKPPVRQKPLLPAFHRAAQVRTEMLTKYSRSHTQGADVYIGEGWLHAKLGNLSLCSVANTDSLNLRKKAMTVLYKTDTSISMKVREKAVG